MNENLRTYGKRFLITFAVALAFVGLINEGAHYFLKEKTDRLPETIEIVIPAGTALRVNGGEADPSIPSELSFVVGDILLVTNQDDVPHELGPLWIPSGSSASMVMEDANKYVLGCTFQPSKYLGLNVNTRTTALSRIQALALAVPPTTMFLFIYGLLVFPISGREKQSQEALA
jgi:hypothetical protein